VGALGGAGGGDGRDPRGGDAGLKRGRYRDLLLRSVFCTRAMQVGARGDRAALDVCS
jgi:hypothetical protein